MSELESGSAPAAPRGGPRELAVCAGAAVVAVPVALRAGAWLGSLSSHLVLAAAPALLLFLALPPLAVAGARAWLGPGGGRLRPAVWAALAAHLLALGAAIALGASAANARDLVLLTLAEALLLPAAVALTRASPPRAHAALPALLLLAVLPRAATAQAACPERSVWPTPDWSTRPLPAGRAEALKALEDYAFTLTGTDAERKGIRTDAVLILHRGALVYERYARGYEAGKRHLGWSMTKSVTNALTGLAVARGAVALDDSLCKHVKPSRQEACGITVRHLLEFGSGLDWRETYEGQSNQASSVLAMLYGEGRRDAVAFITSHAPRDAPGTSWMYSSGDSTLLAGVLDAALRPTLGKDWAWPLLFEPLGIRSASWERDAKGVLIGSSYLYATPRDWARLGYFFLNDGCWAGQRLLPEGWVAASVTPSAPFRLKRVDWRDGDVQGRQFWLNRRVPGIQEALPWPHVPDDAYALRGHWGQSVTVIPSRDLVVVRLADDRERVFKLDTLLQLALAVVEETP